MPIALPRSPLAGTTTIELTAAHAPLLQRFFDANPAYFLATQGEPAGPGEALEEITEDPPASMTWTRKWVVGYAGDDGELVAMANVITDLLAPSIFHIGTFIVATALHGSGTAQRLYQGLEDWSRLNGARWMRLGVVQGNTRAERFWARMGYLPTRPRPGTTMGRRIVTVQAMVKPLVAEPLQAYFRLAPRDDPAGPLQP